ncbi:isoform 4 of ankyrin-2 [Aspergillus udagawae]|nr:isoform 4 of ankyrin-2 [Aspergillus udagawae]
MVDTPAIRKRLAQASQSTRAARRSLLGGREPQDYQQKVVLLLSEILDLLYEIREQLSWAEEKWVVAQERLVGLNDLLNYFMSTIRALEYYFQPSGVSSRHYRKSLLERTFLPRLEQFKVLILVVLQAESMEKTFSDRELRNTIRRYGALETVKLKAVSEYDGDFYNITGPISSKNFMSLADLCNKRQQGTCQWVFQEEKYKSWLFGAQRTLYCRGPPGAGKTFLAASITDSLQRTFTTPDVAVVFLFCQVENGDEESSSISLLANILAQLVYRKRSASYCTASLYQSEEFAKGRASAKAYQNAIRAEVDRFSKIFVIVDGLDTSPEKDRILNRLQKLPEHTQLLITLRETRHAQKDDSILAMAHSKDLENYISTRLNQDAGLVSLLKQYSTQEELKQAIVGQVVEKSHGLFLLARLHMDLLSRCNDAPLLQRALLHLPDSLYDAYAESMKQLASHNLYASRCIFWTLYACRPLTVAELKTAVFFEPQNGVAQKQPSSFEHILLVETAGLLEVDPMTGTVHLIHQTAKEYLTGAAARVFFPTARKHLAETCLTVIMPDEVVDDCYMNQGTTPRTSKGSLLSYAATYWGYHAHEASEEEHTTQVLIGAFINKLCWRRPPVLQDYISETMDIPQQLGLGKYFTDWTALHVLAFFGITGKAKRLIDKGDDVNARDNQLGITPLHCAAHRGNEEMVELLLDHKAEINAICKNGNTAMHYAAEQGQRKVMKILQARRASSRVANRQGLTALHSAIGTAYDEATVPLLIKTRSDMDYPNVITGDTALHIAVELKRQRIVLFLLEKGANTNVLNKKGLTPLQLAAKTDNCEALSVLLERGAKVEARSMLGSRALHLAASEGNWIAFDILLIGGADINAWSDNGESLLHEQSRKASDTAIATHLLEHGANLETRTSQGYTPLQCAAMSGNKAMFFFLLARGAKVDVETPKGESFLHITSPSNQDCLDIIESLLESGLNAKATCSNGWTPLHQTVFMGTGAPDIEFDKTSEYIKLLLSHGADINAAALSATGETPLHLATIAPMPRPSLVSLLVNLGASVNSMTHEGKTPLHLAAAQGCESIFRALLDAGADTKIKVPTSAVENEDDGGGQTPLDIAHKHPTGALWFDAMGNLQFPPEDHQRGSLATTIEIGSDSETDDDMRGSTLVGEEGSHWGSTLSSQIIPSTLSSQVISIIE